MVPGSLRDAWSKLAAPPDASRRNGTRVPGTNAWVYKTHEGGFGLLLSGVTSPVASPDLRNVHLRFAHTKVIEGVRGNRRVVNCLEVDLDPSCDAETLAAIVDLLRSRRPNGDFRTWDLIDILEDAIDVVRPGTLPLSKESVLGAWGELWFLGLVLRRQSKPAAYPGCIRSWEAGGRGRDIVDFRFDGSGIAVEVKSYAGNRIHHFQDLAQVTVPRASKSGYVASVAVEEASSGMTAASLANDIRRSIGRSPAMAKALNPEFDQRLAARGAEATDDHYQFMTREPALLISKMADVPKPTTAPKITNLEWRADLSSAPTLSSREGERLIGSLVA